ncbi:hypothetical protein VQH23_16355 [Pararoseomonas sp. SCSIO 73927]|uniref:hypothetical protein n=1 Tax=Pararoseomonas sp. SCSIO 73927 TaxID=3114537 RepID=UPI0030D3EC2F
MSEAQAARMEAGAEAVMAALRHAGIGEDPVVLAGVLGSVVGCLAAVTENPASTLAAVNRMAEGIISGALLDPA